MAGNLGVPSRVLADAIRAEPGQDLKRRHDLELPGAVPSLPPACRLTSRTSAPLARVSAPKEEGMRLTPSLSTATNLVLESERSLPGGSVEIVYDCV